MNAQARSRSKQKRKRDSTKASVDFFNDINSSKRAKPNTSSRVLSRTKLRDSVRIQRTPRSSDIFEIPGASPEPSQQAASPEEAVDTPSRETRSGRQGQNNNRIATRRMTRPQGPAKKSETEQKNEDTSESSSSDEDEEDKDGPSTRERGLRAVSVQIPLTAPKNTTNKDKRKFNDEGAGDGTGDNRENIPMAPETPQTRRGALSNDAGTPVPGRASGSHMLRNSPRKTYTKPGWGVELENKKEEDYSPEGSPGPGSAGSSGESAVESEPDDSAIESTNLPEFRQTLGGRESEANSTPPLQKRRRLDVQHSSVSTDIILVDDQDDEEQRAQSSQAEPDEQAEDDESSDSDDEDAPGTMDWFEKNEELGPSSEDWVALLKEANHLRCRLEPGTRHYPEIEDLTSDLQYHHDHSRGVGFTTTTQTECETLLGKIERKTDGVIKTVDQKKGKEQHIVDTFEQQVIPPLVDLAISCYLGLHIHQNKFAGRQLTAVVRLLQSLCKLIRGLKRLGIVSSIRCTKCIPRLNRLVEAAESGFRKPNQSQNNRLPDPSDRYDLSDGGIAVPVEWTEDERRALLSGLQQYQGKNRFYETKWLYREELRHRMKVEMRAQACKIRDDNLLAMGEDKMKREYPWLLNL